MQDENFHDLNNSNSNNNNNDEFKKKIPEEIKQNMK